MNHVENQPAVRRKRLLLTGASGMLGHYIQEVFSDFDITTLGRSEGCDVKCDLTHEEPGLPEAAYDLVVHAAGTQDASGARELNAGGTRRLLKALEGKMPAAFVLVSSAEVYGKETGEDVDESSPTWPSGEPGSSKLEAERLAEAAFSGTGTTLTVLRPATMFGSGMKGWAQEMFTDVMNGKYLHIRGNEAMISIVTAFDVARAIREIYPRGGTYNVADGSPVSRLSLAEAMSANAGRHHRMSVLPEKWARTLSGPLSLFPGLRRMFGRESIDRSMNSLTFSAARLAEATGLTFHHTVDVIARKSEGYPYEEL